MRTLLAAVGLALSLVGLLLLAAGAWAPAIVVLALAAVALLPIWVRGPRRIAAGPFAHLILNSAAILGILVCLHLLVVHRGWEWDLTRGARQTLSPITVRQLRALPHPVEITAIASDDSQLRPLLDRLASASPRVSHRVLNPVQDLYAINQLMAALHIANLNDGSIILSATGFDPPRRTVLDALDQGKVVFDEERWVNAMVQITRESAPQVFFVVDHGERDLAQEFKRARQVFENLSFTQDLGSVRRIPEGTDLVVIAGPQRDFTPEETTALSRHMDTGGSALVLLDPGDLPNLERWIADNGVSLPRGVIAEDDPDIAGNFGIADGLSPRVAVVNTHPVTESLSAQGTPLIFREARPVDNTQGSDTHVIDSETLLASHPRHSWIAETRAELAPERRPPANSPDRHSITMAAAATRHLGASGASSRLIVIGDSDWLTDRMDQPVFREGVERLLRGAVGWLVQQEDLIAIPKRTPAETPILLSAPQKRLISAVSIILIPELLLLLGVLLQIARGHAESVHTARVWALALPALALGAVAAFVASRPTLGSLLCAAALLTAALLSAQADGHAARRLAMRLLLGGGAALAVICLAMWLGVSGVSRVQVHPLTPVALSQLQRRVQVGAVSSRKAETEDQMARLAACSALLATEVLHPTLDAQAIQSLIREHAWPLADGQAIASGGDDVTAGPISQRVIARLDEERIVNAAVETGQRDPPRVLVTQGHGEWAYQTDMVGLQGILRQSALLAMPGGAASGFDAEIVLIAGPTEDFSPAELEQLDAHIDEGGSLIVFLDPPTAARIRSDGAVSELRPLPNLVQWLEQRWAVSLPDAIVVDDNPQLTQAGLGTMSPAVLSFNPNHPVSQRLPQRLGDENRLLILREARPVDVRSDALLNNVDVEVLFTAGENTWADADLDVYLRELRFTLDTELRHAVPLAVASQRHRGGRSARAVIIGDSDLLSDAHRLAISEVGFGSLLRGALGWLRQEDPLVAFADAQHRITWDAGSGGGGQRWHSLSGALLGLLLLGGAAFGLRMPPGRGGLPRMSPVVLAVALTLGLAPWLSRAPVRTEALPQERLTSLAPDDITGVSISTGPAPVALERVGSAWQFVGTTQPANGEAVQLFLALLNERTRHSAQEITDGTDLAALGLEPPRARITVTGRGGESDTLLLGNTPAGLFTQVWARLGDEPQVFTVDQALLTLAQRPAERWQVVP